MKKELVSIIVPTYNSGSIIKKSIDSILKQTYENIEIIIVDDGSTDDTKVVYEKNYQKNSKVVFFSKENGGVSSARNFGIKKSSGKWVIFVDSDDTIDEHLVEELLNKANNNNLVGPRLKKIFDNKIDIPKYCEKYSLKKFIIHVVKYNVFGGVHGFLFDKKKMGFFDENTMYMEDTIFLFTYLKKVKEVNYVDSFYNLYYYQNSITNSTNLKKIKRNIKNMSYSIDNINEIISEFKLNLDKELKLKKLIILEAEISKINNKKDINVILKMEDINKIINDLSNIKLNFRYKIFYILLKNKSVNFLWIYIKIKI